MSGNGWRDGLDELLRHANGQLFCEGCLAVELGVGRVDVHSGARADSLTYGAPQC